MDAERKEKGSVAQSDVSFATKLAAIYYRRHRYHFAIDKRELTSVALCALCQARSRYDCKSNAAFSTFAYQRINGALVDYIKSELGYHALFSERQDFTESVTCRPRNRPETEVIDAMRMSVFRSPEKPGIRSVAYVDQRSPEEQTHERDIRKRLLSALNGLSEDERSLINNRFVHNCSFQQIANLAGKKAKAWAYQKNVAVLDKLRCQLETGAIA